MSVGCGRGEGQDDGRVVGGGQDAPDVRQPFGLFDQRPKIHIVHFRVKCECRHSSKTVSHGMDIRDIHEDDGAALIVVGVFKAVPGQLVCVRTCLRTAINNMDHTVR